MSLLITSDLLNVIQQCPFTLTTATCQDPANKLILTEGVMCM